MTDHGRDGNYGYDRDNRPQADPVLTERFERLMNALHGPLPGRDRRPLIWSGVDEPDATFRSIEGQLELPPDRPTSDLPDGSDPSQSGG